MHKKWMNDELKSNIFFAICQGNGNKVLYTFIKAYLLYLQLNISTDCLENLAYIITVHKCVYYCEVEYYVYYLFSFSTVTIRILPIRIMKIY